jgi:hypothetical protein
MSSASSKDGISQTQHQSIATPLSKIFVSKEQEMMAFRFLGRSVPAHNADRSDFPKCGGRGGLSFCLVLLTFCPLYSQTKARMPPPPAHLPPLIAECESGANYYASAFGYGMDRRIRRSGGTAGWRS